MFNLLKYNFSKMTGQDNNAKSGKLHNRYFSEEFKKQKVKELEQKLISIKDLVDLYQISRTTVYQWLYKYSTHYQKDTKIVVQMESEALRTKQLPFINVIFCCSKVLHQNLVSYSYLGKTVL